MRLLRTQRQISRLGRERNLPLPAGEGRGEGERVLTFASWISTAFIGTHHKTALTVACLFAVICLPSFSAFAADPLNRLVNSPQGVNTTLGFENVEQRHPFRTVNGEQIDLRPLFSWINRGRVSRSSKPYDQQCPLPDWRPIDGTIIKVMDDALLVAKGISKSPVILKNYPRNLATTVGTPVSVVAMQAGSFDFASKAGGKDRIPIFDHGVPLTPPPAAVTNVIVRPSLPTNLPPPKSVGKKPARPQ